MIGVTDEVGFMEAFRKGREIAFRCLYDQYYSSLCVYGFRLTGDEQAAGDYVQEAFIRLWENRENFTSLLPIRAYLYTLVKNAALNYLKHLKIQHTHETESTDEALEDSAIELLIRQESERQLTRLIEVLTPDCRRVVSLLAEGKSYKEVGEMLRISPNTVKNHRVKALKILKDTFRSIQVILF